MILLPLLPNYIRILPGRREHMLGREGSRYVDLWGWIISQAPDKEMARDSCTLC